ncbi:MAG: NAD(P)/FAD-dependent oxidoreductase [Fervidobacterium sp.]
MSYSINVAVVGGGPAGVSCALFLKRYEINVFVIEKRSVGGLIENAWNVENIPLFPSTSGKEIARTLRESIEKNDITVVFDEIQMVQENKLIGVNGIYKSNVTVLATGTKPKRIEKFEIDKSVVYEYRDLPNNAKKVAFYGGGDVALDGALRAFYEGKSPVIFVRSNVLRAVPRLINEVRKLGIPIHMEEEILEVSKDKLESLVIKTTKGIYNFDALLLAVGREVNLPTFDKQSNHTNFTNHIFIIGDAAHVNYRQASIATGDGVLCAMRIIENYKNCK